MKTRNAVPGLPGVASAVLAASFVIAASPLYAANTAAAGATTVYLRTSCGAIADCFDNTTALNSWVNGTRRPSASTPLLVDIGAGTFGAIDCDGVGGLSLRGAGRSATILVGGPSAVNGGGAFNGRNCAGVGVQDMTLSGFFWWSAGTPSAVSANVSNVLIVGNSAAVFEYCTSSIPQGANTINWWSSRLESNLGATVFAGCAEHRFFGSDILRTVGANSDLSRGAIALELFGGETPSVSLYGTSVRAKMAPGAIVFGTIYGVTNHLGGTFHSHGGEIVVDARGGAQNVGATAVHAQNAVATHIVETSFGVHPSTGGVARRVESWKNDPVSGLPVADPDTLQAPFLWTAGKEPPPLAAPVGAAGQDMFVERGCTSTGNCADGSGGGEPHLMIYTGFCGSTNPWFDVVTGRCRNQ